MGDDDIAAAQVALRIFFVRSVEQTELVGHKSVAGFELAYRLLIRLANSSCTAVVSGIVVRSDAPGSTLSTWVSNGVMMEF